MNTFRNKHFKNKLDPIANYYECIRSREINKSTEKSEKFAFYNAKYNYQLLKDIDI